jgi:molecular chaperone DnaK (HSP70)
MNIGLEIENGSLSIVIKKNTKIPGKKTSLFSTAVDNQTAATFKIYEGERTMAKDNHKLGEFFLGNIEPAPKGEMSFDTIFDISADGILKVTAIDKKNGNTKDITVKSNTLTKEEIQKMYEDAEKNRHQDALIKTVLDT